MKNPAADPFDNPPEKIELEHKSDFFRQCPPLAVSHQAKPDYPTRPEGFPFTTDDEIYQFREPNRAYNDGSIPNQLPDGLQSDGTPCRHFGEQSVSHEDNEKEIRHNIAAGTPHIPQLPDVPGTGVKIQTGAGRGRMPVRKEEY